MRIIDKLKNRESLTPTENAIAHYLQENSREATNMSLNELADALHASKSSIIRFCKKLGYKGHKELSVELAKELDAFVYHDRELDLSVPFVIKDDPKTIADKTFTLVSGALNDTWNDLDSENVYRISRMIYEKKNLYVYAGEDGYLLAKEFISKLETIGFHAYLKEMPGMNIQQASVEESESIALFIYYDESSDELVKIAQILSNKNIPIITLTGPEKSGVLKYATDSISVSYFEPSPKIAGFGSFTALQLVLNIIYANIFCMDYEKNITIINNLNENRKKITSVK